MATPTHEDLAKLDNFDEKVLLAELKARYMADRIYTYVGDILLAFNPFKKLRIYEGEIQKYYKGTVLKDTNPPHIYFMANNGYESMFRSKKNQCFVISGESGAGKTETTKFIVSHVIELCRANKNFLEENIKRLNPLLEAFGNAKTIMNDNSSRFGKFLELKFERGGPILGAYLSEYLLEKSRVTSQSAGERNYHIFYYLFAGLNPDLKSEFGLTKPSDYAYIHGPEPPSDDSVLSAENKARFDEVVETLHSMNYQQGDVASMLRVVAAILHLGNVTFSATKDETASISSSASLLANISSLLSVDRKDLEEVLVGSESEVRPGEKMRRHYNTEQASDARNALAKAIYARLFLWLIRTCNDSLIDKSKMNEDSLSLGILDIFGFEIFKSNSLEQLCINVANEQLQFYFNNFIFAMEQAEYERQGVAFQRIPYNDNQPTLDLFLKKPEGVFMLLDEESRFPKATDLTFTEKLAKLKTHVSGALIPAKSNSQLEFSVVHYAGSVAYQTKGFLEKNRDALSTNMLTCLQRSSDSLVASLFGSNGPEKGPAGAARKVATVCSGFASSLTELMEKLNVASPHFVRCVRPNYSKVPRAWEEDVVEKQLRYSGVMETVTIRKMGYSVRETFPEFFKRYKVLGFKYSDQPPPTKDSCIHILNYIKLKDWTVGHEKVFLKYYHPEQLTVLVQRHRYLLLKYFRAFVARFRFRRMKKAKRAQDESIRATLAFLEDFGERISSKTKEIAALDGRDEAKRPWIIALRKAEEEERKRLEKEKEREEKERQARDRAQSAAGDYTVTKTKTRAIDGAHVWQRNEQLTLRVGPLRRPWEKKIDKATGRVYFKNHETRQTTWVDPRTALTRKMDAKECGLDELPYGWDEGEVNGETYYIDHNTQKTYWLHPRLLLEEKREEYEEKQRTTEEKAKAKRATIKVFRDKRQKLEHLLEQVVDEDELKAVQQRIAAMDSVIEKESDNLRVLVNENSELRKEIKDLKTQFDKIEFEAEHGFGTFEPGVVADLYAIKGTDTLPKRLDTMTRDMLRRKSTFFHDKNSVRKPPTAQDAPSTSN